MVAYANSVWLLKMLETATAKHNKSYLHVFIMLATFNFILLKLYFAGENSICINFKTLYSLLVLRLCSFLLFLLTLSINILHHPNTLLLYFILFYFIHFSQPTATTMTLQYIMLKYIIVMYLRYICYLKEKKHILNKDR